MAAPINNTVEELLLQCGVPNDNVLFNGVTKAARIATEVFGDDLNSCMDISFDDFEKECQTYAGLTVAQGQIRLTPGTKRNIKALIQWCRAKIIIGLDPAHIAYPNTNQMDLICQYKTHANFREKSKSISDIAKPEKFKDDTKWIDWYPNFINFLRAIPGVTGIPLSYIIRNNDNAADEDASLQFLDNYVNMAPLTGEAYDADNAEVHTYLIHFVSGHSVAEAKIIAHGHNNNGRQDYLALRNHFEGIGINALEITKAENIINTLFYSGEKKPHMWWGEFEKELSRAFAIYQRVENREVHSNHMKLRILMSKIQADFLEQTKAALVVEMSKTPMVLRYSDALATIRNAVNFKYPPNMSSNPSRVRRINETSQGGRGNPGGGRMPRGRGRYGRGGRGSSSGRGRGRGRGGSSNSDIYYINGNARSQNTWMTVSQTGKTIECHPRASYPGEIWAMIPKADKDKIHNIRKGNSPSGQQSVISEVTQGTQYQLPSQFYYQAPPTNPTFSIQQAQQMQPPLPPPPPPRESSPVPPPQVSFMGGRNEQSSLRSRTPHS